MHNLVSVIITTHNRYEGLKNAVNSVMMQTYRNLECIIIDDASDNFNQIILKDINDIRVRYYYIPKENSRGGNHARNVGISKATGEYVAFLDDDDEWFPTKIEKQLALYATGDTDLGLVYCGSCINFRATKNITTQALPDKAFKGNLSDKVFTRIFCRTSMLMIPRKVINDVDGFDEQLKFWQEYDLTIRICQKYKVDFVDEALVVIRQEVGDKERLSNKFDAWKENLVYFERKHENIIENLSKSNHRKWNSLIYYDAAARCEMIGDRKSQKHYLWLSWKYDKTMAKFLIACFNLRREQINRLRQWNDMLGRKKNARRKTQ